MVKPLFCKVALPTHAAGRYNARNLEESRSCCRVQILPSTRSCALVHKTNILKTDSNSRVQRLPCTSIWRQALPGRFEGEVLDFIKHWPKVIDM
jgi:hypothetical protein